MTAKEELHQLIDALPESDFPKARRFLRSLSQQDVDPFLESLREAPLDDEPETPEEAAAVLEAREQLSRGELISDEELWRKLGHEPAR